MRSLAILALGLSVVLISGTSGHPHEVLGYCDDDAEDGSCSAPPVTPSNVYELAEELKEEATYKAHAILRALNYDPSKVDEESTEVGEDNDGRYPRFYNFGGFGMTGSSFGMTAMNKALAVLKIFDIDFNANAYVEKAGVGVGTGIEIGTTSPPRTPRPATTNYPPAPPPAGCNCTQNNYEPCRGGDGICSSAAECNGMGGESIGKCANCLGCSVCCKYVAGCQGMTDKMITYFQSPAYPRTDRSNEVCSLTVNVRDEVCQVRLDLIDFEMAAPVCGDCSVVDNMEIVNTGQPGGVFGNGPSRLCGLNSGQHVYMPVNGNNIVILKATTTGVRNVPLAATDGRNRGLSGDTAFRWSVRVTQIPCRAADGDVGMGGGGGGVAQTMEVSVGGGTVSVSSAVGFEGRNGACRCKIHKHYKRLLAPEGCTQFFDDNRGKLKSFNFDARSEVGTGLDYSICVRRPNDACGMTLNALTFSLPASPYCLSGEEAIDCYGGLVSHTAMEQAKGKMTVCCTGSKDGALPGANYFGFAGFTDGQTMRTMRGSAYDPNQNRYFYCGSQLGNGSLVVGRTKGPLIMRVKTSEDYWGQCCLGGVCSAAELESYSRKRRAIEPRPLGYPETAPGPRYPSDLPLPESYCPDGGCLGFLINYDVNTGSC